MFAVQPVGFNNYLTFKKNTLPKNLSRTYYVSWEDALWDLLERYTLPSKKVILIPSFFCKDVVENMKAHGLLPVYYPMGKDFQTSVSIFRTFLKKYKPSVVVIFHPVGITNKLLKTAHLWQHDLPEYCLLVEDCVHKVVLPTEIMFIHDKHFVIDSLRKVTPLPGSNLYSRRPLPLRRKNNMSVFRYTVSVLYWWLVFQTLLSLGNALYLKRWRVFFFALAEKAMIRGYNKTGDSLKPGKGWPLLRHFPLFLNFSKIRNSKETQVQEYVKHLKELEKSSDIFFFTLPTTDYKNLRGFPIGLYLKNAESILEKIRSSGLLLRFELEDCPWSKKNKVMYLPLGPHLGTREIRDIAGVVNKCVLA